MNISDGNFNKDYVSRVRTIGTVHARIGLEPNGTLADTPSFSII
ncbi:MULTISPECIES: hypothetical protein [Rhizobium]|nr:MULTISPECIES: hypothetical protein [Rhizobium]EJK88042.1 hypothetical protein PMI03_00200 [Rhizobium sp. AP16]